MINESTLSKSYFPSEASTSKDQINTISLPESSINEDIEERRKKKIKLSSRKNKGDKSTSSTSTSGSSRRRKIQFIKSIHSYSISPSKLKKQNVELKARQAACRKKLYKANKKIVALKKKVTDMKAVMDFLNKNQQLSNNAADHLESTYDSVPHILMRRYLKNIERETISHEAYPPVLRQFAATLQFYSAKAYETVRKEFAMSLPHQATIRKWYQNINCEPGFILVAFNALRAKVQEYHMCNREVICSLIIDEVSIKKQLDFDGQQMWSYANIGINIDNDQLKPTSEAFILIVVCHNEHCKIPSSLYPSLQEKKQILWKKVSYYYMKLMSK